ncbi:MAG: RDD family protein [Bacilli bacterium]|jgi:uncharacterized RDD family membrane protein YckC
MNIAPANLAKRSGAAILDFLLAVLVWLALITYAVSPIYNQVFGTRAIQDDYIAIQLATHLYVEDTETKVITYRSDEDIPDAVYAYYSEFKVGKTYADEATPFAFTNEWYNSNILNIGTSDATITVYFEYDLDEFEVPDPSLRGVPKTDATEEQLGTFYQAAYQSAQLDLNDYGPYAELAAQISSYSLQILAISGSVTVLIFYLLLPLIFKNGQTLAKKLFNLGVIGKQGYKLKAWQLLVRFLMFAAEIVLSVYTIMGAFLISYTLMIFTKGNRSAHDFVAQTRVVNLKESLIFANAEDAAAYEKKLAAEEAYQSAKRQAYQDMTPATPTLETESKIPSEENPEDKSDS